MNSNNVGQKERPQSHAQVRIGGYTLVPDYAIDLQLSPEAFVLYVNLKRWAFPDAQVIWERMGRTGVAFSGESAERYFGIPQDRLSAAYDELVAHKLIRFDATQLTILPVPGDQNYFG